jgi:hypothetical protein
MARSGESRTRGKVKSERPALSKRRARRTGERDRSDGVAECWSVGVLERRSIGVMEYWSIGVVEYWSGGCRPSGAVLCVPRIRRKSLLQDSITPLLRYSRRGSAKALHDLV